jgi:hypothetical protein
MSKYFGFILSLVSPSVLHLPDITTVSLDIESLAKERPELRMQSASYTE